MNSTSYDIHFVQEMNIRSHTEAHINTETAPFWTDTFIDIFADDKPTDVYYWVNQVDNESEDIDECISPKRRSLSIDMRFGV